MGNPNSAHRSVLPHSPWCSKSNKVEARRESKPTPWRITTTRNRWESSIAMSSRACRVPFAVLLLSVGLVHFGLILGHQPVGSDPDFMYRPYKQQLAEALRHGTLPFWSDRFGLGIPLIAESHVAAFYPPNLIAYRLLEVETAYRVLMLLSYLGLAASTFAYARSLEIEPWGAALAGLSFTLCGFQANHAVHEWAVNAVPYLPLNLWLADRLVKTGNPGAMATLALLIGVQITIGHFQTQWMTLALVTITGLLRVRFTGLPATRLIALAAAIVWGFAIASLTLLASAEMVRFTGFQRPAADLGTYPFVPIQVVQTLLPRLFNGFRDGITDPFWFDANTTGLESSLYFGAVPLILIAVGFVSRPRDPMIAAWRWIALGSLALAVLPIVAPSLFLLIARLPGFGTFRCPARYTLITSLGAALLAGQAFDRRITARTFRRGLGIASSLMAVAAAWALSWFLQPAVLERLPVGFVPSETAASIVTYLAAIASLIAWKRGRLGPWGPFAITLLELGALFHHSATHWDWSGQTIAESPVFQRLAREPRVGLVAGPLFDLPVLGGFTPAFAYTGIPAPAPNTWLLTANSSDSFQDPRLRCLFERFGVTHGVWSDKTTQPDAEIVYEGPDPWLDRTANYDMSRSTWRLVRYADAFPPARVVIKERISNKSLTPSPSREKVAVGRMRDANQAAQPEPAPLQSDLKASIAPTTLDFNQDILKSLTEADPAMDTVLYGVEDRPATPLTAQSAKLLSWDGREAVVEHDGTCDLVVNRTFYPGWVAEVDGAPGPPIHKADGGVQSVRIEGRGTTRIALIYHPTWLIQGLWIAGLAALSAILTILIPIVRRAVKVA